MKVNNFIADNILINNGFHQHCSYDVPYCDWYIWLNNSRLLTLYKGEARQYKVKRVGSRDYFSFECTESKFIKTKIVKDLIAKGILIDEEAV